MALSDEALMQAYQAGDSLAFEALYLRAAPKLYGYLRKKLSTTSEVDDLFQQIFLKLHRTRTEYDPRFRFEQWLFVIARSSVLDHYRNKQRVRAVYSDEDVANFPDPIAVEQEPNGIESAILEGLSAEQREVIELKVREELTYQEIAERLSRSEVSVRQLFSRAVRRLRKSQGLSVKRGSES